MHSHVLVAYASRTGSTEEVAASITATLREHNLVVDLLPVTAVHSLEGYSAVVLGAALYIGRLHKDVRRFVSANRAALETLPVGLFVLGPVEKTEKQWTDAQHQLVKQLAKFPWFKPIVLRIVGGRFDPSKLGFPFKWTLRNIPVSDALDWEAIRAFAQDLAARFQPELATSTD